MKYNSSGIGLRINPTPKHSFKCKIPVFRLHEIVNIIGVGVKA